MVTRGRRDNGRVNFHRFPRVNVVLFPLIWPNLAPQHNSHSCAARGSTRTCCSRSCWRTCAAHGVGDRDGWMEADDDEDIDDEEDEAAEASESSEAEYEEGVYV